MAKRTSITIADIKNRSSRRPTSRRKMYNGRVISSRGATAKVMSFSQKLIDRSAMKEANSTASTIDVSLDVLNAIGCTILDEGPLKSLVALQTDKENIFINREQLTIDGEAITAYEMSNKIVKATDKFKDVDEDPFYILDDGPFRNMRIQLDNQKKKQVPDTRSVVSALYELNVLDKSTLTLKYLN